MGGGAATGGSQRAPAPANTGTACSASLRSGTSLQIFPDQPCPNDAQMRLGPFMPQATMNQYPDTYDGPLPRCVITQQALSGYEYRYRFVLEKVVLGPGPFDPKISHGIVFQGSIADPAPGVEKTPCGYVFALNVQTERTPLVTAKAGDELTMAGQVVPLANDQYLAAWAIHSKDGRLLYAAVQNDGGSVDSTVLGGLNLTTGTSALCLRSGPPWVTLHIEAAGQPSCLFDTEVGGCCTLWGHEYLAYALGVFGAYNGQPGGYFFQIMDRAFVEY